MAKSITKITLATVLATLAVSAQDSNNQTIVGCAAIGCPASTQDTANDNCTVAGRSFPYVGITSIPSASEALSGLAWSKGFNITDSQDQGGRTFGSSFYLDTPADLDLGNTGACAIFFHGASPFLTFDRDAPTDETTQGTCGDAMGSACVDALTKRARDLDVGDATSPGEACDKLREDFEKNMDDACLQISKGSWSNLTSVGKCRQSPPIWPCGFALVESTDTDLSVLALTGSGAPEPITGQQNASSNCWPATDREDSLTLVSDLRVPVRIIFTLISAHIIVKII